jgi:prolipoprotein diacylglyceryltransferase
VACGAIFVRFGNFFNSEIIGHETNSPFGIRFLHDKFSKSEISQITNIADPKDAYYAVVHDPKFISILEMVPAKHPTQLYEAFFYIFVFAILLYAYWKTDARLKQGYLLGLFLILLWTVRFFVEFVKESQGGFESELGTFSTGQWLSIPFIIAGFVLLFTAKKTTEE